ncbi:MAG: ComF family protein [Acidobacteria bacterium]|nr:ComF family protein [Acidobacteriota bacterium]
MECGQCGFFLQGTAVLHQTRLCGLCRRRAFRFEQARSFAAYEGTLQSLIQRFKYDGLRPLAQPLSELLAEAARRLEPHSWDLILPVPLHRRRQRQRGFNQAELLASRLSKTLRVPLGTKDCVRIRDTRPQTGLRAAERRKNVAGAFHVPRPESVSSLRVLLVDDVLTTGATVNACAQALGEAGARGVWVATLARAKMANADVL